MKERYSLYVKNAGLYLFATLISSALGIIINPLLAMNLSPEDYAAIGYYGGFSTLFTPLMAFFLIDYFLKNRFLLEGEELRRLKATIIKMFIFFSSGVMLLCLLGLFVYVKFTGVSIPFSPYAILTLLGIYFTLLFSFRTADLKIDRKANVFFRLTVTQGVLNAGFALLFVVVIKWGATGKMLATLLVGILFSAYCIYAYRDLFKIPFDHSRIKPIIRYSVPLVLAGTLGFFTTGFDKVLLERQKDLYSLGIYAVAVQMSGYINVFSTAIKTTFQPDAYQAIADKNLKRLIKTIFLNVGLVSIIVLLFIIF